MHQFIEIASPASTINQKLDHTHQVGFTWPVMSVSNDSHSPRVYSPV